MELFFPLFIVRILNSILFQAQFETKQTNKIFKRNIWWFASQGKSWGKHIYCDNKFVEPLRRLEFMFEDFCFSFSFCHEIYLNSFSFLWNLFSQCRVFANFFANVSENKKCICKRIAKRTVEEERRPQKNRMYIFHSDTSQIARSESADSNDRNYVLITSDLLASPRNFIQR